MPTTFVPIFAFSLPHLVIIIATKSTYRVKETMNIVRWAGTFIITCCIALVGCSQENVDSAKNDTIKQSTPEESNNKTPSVQDNRDSDDTSILSILDISERTKDGKNAIAVTLSKPLDLSLDFQSYFNVSDTSDGIVDGGWELSESGKIVWFSHTEPNTTYEITIYQGLKAARGQELQASKTETISTRNLRPSVNFDTSGAFLTQGMGSGLPVVAVNINEVDIDFFKIKEDELSSFISSMRSDNYYYYVDNLTKQGKLTYSGRYTLDVPKNTRVTRRINIQDHKELSEVGVYLAVMRPAGQYEKKQIVWFSVTDIGMHARVYENQLDIYISSLTKGEALKNVTVSLLDQKSQLIKQIKSSPDGLASFSGDISNASLVVARDKQHLSLIELKKPALDLSEFDLGNRPQLPVEAFVYTARDLFRPGELVDFNALVRDFDGNKTHSPVLHAEIRRPNGSVAKKIRWSKEIDGYYHYEWQIPNDAPVGNWEFVIGKPLKTRQTYSFKVEEFLPERMKITYNNGEKQVSQFNASNDIEVDVLGEYLYGAPAANNRLSTIVNVSQWRSPIEVLKDYQFGNVNEQDFNQRFDLDDIKLNSEGKTSLQVSSRWKSVSSPLRIKFINSLYESGGRPVSRTYSALVWPKNALVGIRPHFGDKNPESNSRVKFDVIKANSKGQLLNADNLEVKLIREDRQYFWTFSDHRGWHWDWSDKEYPEFTQSLSLQATKPRTLEFPVSWGNYRLEVSDPESNTTSSIRFYAGYNWYQDWQNAQQGSGAARPDSVTVALDKASYSAGDIANVTIVPPDAAEALVIVEGDTPLWMERISLKKGTNQIDIPIDENWQHHNIYISVVALQAAKESKVITPKRSFGIVHLPLNRNSRKLNIDIDIPEKTLPEKTLIAKVKIASAASIANTPIYLTLAAVDVGVLSISDFETPDPYQAFFGQRRYGVDVKDMYHKVIERSDTQQARLRFGGDQDLQRGGDQPQSEVQIVSLFSGLVEVSADGYAEIPLDLPDFNGKLRLMALAFSDDSFGHQEEEITVASPIVTQIAMPRFLAAGDTSHLAVDIHNLTDETHTLIINMESDGPVQLNYSPQEMILEKNKKQTITYPIKAIDYQGQASIKLHVSGEKIEDFSRQWKLGVRPPYPAMITQKRKALARGEEFTIDASLFANTLPGTMQAVMSASPVVDMNIENQLQHLLSYPYGCLEQTTSRSFPLLYASKENQSKFNIKNVDQKTRFEMIEKGLTRISSLQLANGGFGLWDNRSNEQHWLTAYVGDFLVTAKNKGVDVPQEMLDSTMRRLKRYLNRNSRFVNERWSQNRDHYNFAYKAYAAYVLAKVNQAPLGSMRTLYDKYSKNAKSGFSQAQLGIALLKMGDKKRGNEAIETALTNFNNERRYWGDYGSSVRDYGMLIHLLISNDVFVKQAQELSFKLAEEIRNRRWFSTQERTAMFLAGLALQRGSSDVWQAQFIENINSDMNITELQQKSNFKKRLNEDQIKNGVMFRSKNQHTLFINSEMQSYSASAPPEEFSGFSIYRHWFNSKGEEVTPNQVQVGDLFLVHIEVSADKRSPDALIVDLLPAGFELENQNLDHAIKLEDFKIDGKSITKLRDNTTIKYQEYRDDRYVGAVDISSYRSSHLFYLVRAVTPGEYKVPVPFVEDMYQPERRATGSTLKSIRVKNN